MESTSALRYEDLASHVADFAGYGPTAPFDTTGSLNTSRIDRAVRGGCRKVYNPVPPYDWSWLHLYITLLLPANQSVLQLPDDCAGIEGDLIVAISGTSPSGSIYPRVELTNPEFVKANLATTPSSTGWPRIAAIEQLKGSTLISGQRQQLIIYPLADRAYTVSFAYYVVPDSPAPAPPAGTQPGTPNANYPGITTGLPYVYGGAAHAELFKEACLAEWESLYDDMSGLHAQAFQMRLLASMAVDRRSKPQYLGKNGDSSDNARRRCGRGWNTGPAQYVLYNGSATN